MINPPSENTTPPASLGDEPNAANNGFEPIAIVGLSLRFPHQATSENGFWQMMERRESATTEFPKDRLNIDAFYHADPSRHDTLPVRGGNFIKDDVRSFDAPFFSITPAEAACMDPQQRGMLEVSFRALENAGITMEDCSGSNTSVYTATFTDDYRSVLLSDPEVEHRYAATGLSASILANRISWFFNLRGASMNLDSACSSSLTALHLACQELQSRDSSIALVGGCNLFYHPDFMLMMSNFNFLSPDGQCWSFDIRANGYARGEGFGMVVLKRLADAVRDRNTIRAVIRSTGLNQDGKTPGIIQPSQEAQTKLILETYRKANIEMSTTRFFEAHGTGTPIGDPIEANAIGRAFRNYRSVQDPLFVGAVKANIGHLEGGSGMAGLIKTVLALENGIIPPNAGFKNANPQIDQEYLRISFPTKPTPWPGDGIRRACVNSFGFGGSNATVILDYAYSFLEFYDYFGFHTTVLQTLVNDNVKQQENQSSESCSSDLNGKFLVDHPQKVTWVLVISAADEQGINRLGEEYGRYFQDKLRINEALFDDVAYTLAMRRTRFAWRAHLTIQNDAVALKSNLKLLKATRVSVNRALCFVFTGQGAQYAQMGKDLQVFPTFKASIRESEKTLKAIGCPWSLTDVLFGNDSGSIIDDPEFSQPLSTALQLAIVDLLRSFNIHPSAVVGHSSGEIAAAYCSTALSRHAAMKIAFHRGRLATNLIKANEQCQTMMSVNISEHVASRYLQKLETSTSHRRVYIGCINSPANVTLTGDKTQLNILESWFVEDSVPCRKLRIEVAYHSQFMQPIADEYRALIGSFEKERNSGDSLKMVSTVTGSIITPQDLRQPDYWVNNLLSPVKFLQAISSLLHKSPKKPRKQLGAKARLDMEVTDVLEIGPHAALRGPILDTLSDRNLREDIQYLSAVIRGAPAAQKLADAAGYLSCRGYPIDILTVNMLKNDPRAIPRGLPQYPFNHSEVYWNESRESSAFRFRKHGRHDLLGTPNSLGSPFAQWRNFIDTQKLPWIEDHKINGQCLYPAAGLLVMAIEAVRQKSVEAQNILGFKIRDATFIKAFQITENSSKNEVQLTLLPYQSSRNGSDSWYNFKIFVSDNDSWNECCHGQIVAITKDRDSELGTTHEVVGAEQKDGDCLVFERDLYQEKLETTDIYKSLSNNGAVYGTAFQTMGEVRLGADGKVIGNIATWYFANRNVPASTQTLSIHPTTLDGLFQLVYPALIEGGRKELPTMVPSRVGKLWVSANGIETGGNTHLRAFARCKLDGYQGTNSSVTALATVDDVPLVVMEDYETTFVTSNYDHLRPDFGHKKLCCTMTWRPDVALMTGEEILRICEKSRPDSDQPARFYNNLSLAIFWYIREGLKAVDCAKRADYPPHLLLYIEWMRYQDKLHTTSEHKLDQDIWQRFTADSEFRSSIIKELKNANKEGKLLTTVGENLTLMLLRELDPLQLFFEGDLADEYYQEVFSEPSFCRPFETYLELLTHKFPSMNILEIGAGTGGATTTCLSILAAPQYQKWSQYDYTDISPAFFAKARPKFGPYTSKMRFKVLDIESDPVEQGFNEAAYDVVIAANVLHATKNLAQTLKNTRKLMKPGGKLILFEFTKPEKARAGFAFGLLKGWWAAADGVRGWWSPCLSESAWNNVLCCNGFSGVDFLIPNFTHEECHEISIIVSTAASLPFEPPKISNIAIVVDEASTVQLELGEKVSAQIGVENVGECQLLTLGQLSTARNLSEIFLLFLGEIERPVLRNMSSDYFAKLQSVLLAVRGVLWVTRDSLEIPQRANLHMVDGFGRALRSENPRLKFVRLALETRSNPRDDRAYVDIVNTLNCALSTDIANLEPELEQRDGMLHINRVIENSEMNELLVQKTSPKQNRNLEIDKFPPLKLYLGSPGLLESLHFREDEEDYQRIGPDEVVVQVKAIGINFRDHQLISGHVNSKHIGTKCSGVIEHAGSDSGFQPGEKVCISALACAKTKVRCKAMNLARIPDSMSFATAAASPTAALLSFWAIVESARLSQNESVLIHDAASSVGQSAIQLAQWIGAEIFVTVGTKEKMQLLIDEYGILRDHIFSTKPDIFLEGIKHMTSRKGVDVVLNTRSGEFARASTECVGKFGRIVDIALSDRTEEQSFQERRKVSNLTFISADLSTIIMERPSIIQKLWKGVMERITKGQLRPPSVLNVFPASDIQKAFSSFHKSDYSGKVIIDIDPRAKITVSRLS